MDMNKKIKVFVYGTLLSNEINNRLLVKDSFLCSDIMRNFQMFNLGGFPYCLSTEDNKDIVKGEVYEVTESTFRNLDHLEGYPHFYTRIQAKTDKGHLSWIYILKARTKDYGIISSGDWKDV